MAAITFFLSACVTRQAAETNSNSKPGWINGVSSAHSDYYYLVTVGYGDTEKESSDAAFKEARKDAGISFGKDISDGILPMNPVCPVYTEKMPAVISGKIYKSYRIFQVSRIINSGKIPNYKAFDCIKGVENEIR